MGAVTPANTHAIVVGVEHFDAGPTWNLDGPASDAIRVLEYLRQHEVPAANIQALLAPLPENAALTDRAGQLAASLGVPTQAAVDDLIEKRLPALKIDLLLLFWAGHGIITLEDERRVYTADATPGAKRNVDVNSLLAALRSDVYPHIGQQAVIVDACANYIPNPTAKLTQKTYSAGAGRSSVSQFAIFAASPGEYAKNLNAEKAGLMSRELMAVLAEQNVSGAWPPDFEAAAKSLATRFIRLRQDGKTRQTPSTFWFRTPTSSGQYLGQTSVTGAGPAVAVPRKLTIAEQKNLIDGFLQLDTMRSRADRDSIVRYLRPEIATRIDRRDADRPDVANIISKSRSFNALAELLQCVEAVEGESAALLALIDTAHGMLPEEVSASLSS